jgi:hypothetical protein
MTFEPGQILKAYESEALYYLLRTKFGAYVRTGHFWRRYYWYCRS